MVKLIHSLKGMQHVAVNPGPSNSSVKGQSLLNSGPQLFKETRVAFCKSFPACFILAMNPPMMKPNNMIEVEHWSPAVLIAYKPVWPQWMHLYACNVLIFIVYCVKGLQSYATIF